MCIPIKTKELKTVEHYGNLEKIKVKNMINTPYKHIRKLNTLISGVNNILNLNEVKHVK